MQHIFPFSSTVSTHFCFINHFQRLFCNHPAFSKLYPKKDVWAYSISSRTAVSFFFIAQTTHTCVWRRHTGHTHRTDTHTYTRRSEVAVNSTSAFNPSRIVPPPGSSRSSGQLLSARGPIEPTVSVRDGQECSVLFACFSVGVISGGNPL